ncbi:hypothetical protein SE17_05630 [Kouleothrix aurantiaca]|uniref:LuxR family transcriptional regulator n=1 Tax=Kouleothrix aurantiaca TaxID=186479 RepID=A0A0P9DVJ8_9CHLR|nr:hypothetical protein SE17_05630 [Kouleothrix aurantiaca]
MKTRIFLAEDHHLVREGLRLLLEQEADFEVVGEASEGRAAAEAALRPDVDGFVMDVVMPHLNGLDVARLARNHNAQSKIVALSMYTNEAYIAEALQAGASAYVLKQSTAADLIAAIRTVLLGGTYLSPPLNQRSVNDYARRAAEPPAADIYDSLTERERQVLHLAAQGLKNADIAKQLSLSIRTVEMHRANMLKKLNLKTQVDIVYYALRRGLVS